MITTPRLYWFCPGWRRSYRNRPFPGPPYKEVSDPVIRKAVIPVAGFGTRMLPASKSIPKEMLPVVDRPAIAYVVDEAVRAGITEIILVSHASKSAVENYFDGHP
ncbi:MAG TPA: hypothetical protein DEB61_00755, partial [Alcanivorax sp.]|nr:hypothetical protein [Alcanivorax sp.]HBU64017.1 hypothetical protein [Alcanivorax sp.]